MGEGGMFIGEVAKRAGVNPKTIRYYEAIGLLPKPQRGRNGYRIYSTDVMELLRFARKAQGFGFRLSEIKELVTLRRTGQEPCVHVQALTERKIADLDERLKDLATLKKKLQALLSRSKGQRKQREAKAVICPHIEALPPRANATMRLATQPPRRQRRVNRGHRPNALSASWSRGAPGDSTSTRSRRARARTGVPRRS